MAWVVTAPTQTQTPSTGWVSTITTTPSTPEEGWVGSYAPNIMGRLSGGGTLTVTTQAHPFLYPQLASEGTLLAPVIGRKVRSAAPSGTGTLSVIFGQILPATAQFNGTGFLSGMGIPTLMYPQFSGDGEFIIYEDGLSAIVYPIYLPVAGFSGDGTLAVYSSDVHLVDLALTGDGSLTATIVPWLPPSSLTGDGALSATAIGSYGITVLLTGSGSLSATAFATYLCSGVFTGSGSLTVLVQTVAPVAFSGDGALSASVSQVYSVTATLSGDGVLSALFKVPGGVITGVLTGDGALTATTDNGHHYSDDFGGSNILVSISVAGDGALSATTTQAYPLTPTLTGQGALSATAFASYGSIAALTGTGALSATTVQDYSLTPALTGSGALSGTLFGSYASAAALTGTGSLSSTLFGSYASSAALTGGGALSATVKQVYPLTPALSGTGALSATAFGSYASSATLSGTGTLSATAVQRYTAGTNQLLNPDFLYGFSPGWTPFGGTVWWDGTSGHIATGAAKLYADGTYNNDLVSDVIACSPGDVISVSIWMNYQGFTSTAPDAVQVAAETYLNGTTVGYPELVQLAPSGTNFTWQQYTATYTIPTGVNQFALRPSVRSTGTGTTWWDDADMRNLNEPQTLLVSQGELSATAIKATATALPAFTGSGAFVPAVDAGHHFSDYFGMLGSTGTLSATVTYTIPSFDGGSAAAPGSTLDGGTASTTGLPIDGGDAKANAHYEGGGGPIPSTSAPWDGGTATGPGAQLIDLGAAT